jgi:hypothetical protein
MCCDQPKTKEKMEEEWLWRVIKIHGKTYNLSEILKKTSDQAYEH